MVGRTAELQRVLELVAKKRHALIIGDVGLGKSTLLQQVQNRLLAALYVEHLTPPKAALLSILKQLKELKRLKIAGLDAEYLDWKEIVKKISRLTVGDLTDVLVENLRGKDYVLLIDELERLTPTGVPIVERLLEVCTVVGATRSLTSGREKLWWQFQQVELPPLNREDAKTLLWQLVDASKVKDVALFETKVLSAANGNPLAIKQMAEQVANEPEVTQQVIRQLSSSAGVRYVDLTFCLLIIGAVVVAARFISLGLNDQDLYIIAGVGSALFLVVRYGVFRLLRK